MGLVSSCPLILRTHSAFDNNYHRGIGQSCVNFLEVPKVGHTWIDHLPLDYRININSVYYYWM